MDFRGNKFNFLVTTMIFSTSMKLRLDQIAYMIMVVKEVTTNGQ